MASALLASRNEPSWGENKVYMRKNPNSNPNPRLRPTHNPNNPSPNTNPNHIISPHGGPAHRNHLHAMESDDLPTADPDAAVAVSDNCSSFSRRDPGGYVTFNISAYSKKELRELRRRLMSELDQVRSVSYRLSARELQASSARASGYSAFGGGREVTSSAAPPPTAGSDALIDRSGPPRTNQACRPHEIKKWGSAANPEMRKLVTTMMKKCGQILSRLMKHKGAIWFNTPVDAVKMNLPDYHQVIKSPMDLGTVKTKLRKGLYTSPLDFAFDIRLTFQNALLYNPKEHQVHTFAGMLLQQFEGLFGPPFSKYEKQLSSIVRSEEELRQRALNLARVAPLPLEAAMKADHSPPLVYSPPLVRTPVESRPLPPPAAAPAVHAQLPKHHQQQQPRRIPKPKVKDVNKRPMTIEEKEKLSIALQNLPDDKSSQMLQIMQKRKVGMSMEGDVVELDFEQMDNETLWELDRFVCNMEKKRKHEEAEMTKKSRQEEAAGGSHCQLTRNASSAAAPYSPPPPRSPHFEAGNKSPLAAAVVDEETPEAGATKRSKRGDPVDEDVDIGDEMPVTTYPSVEIEKEGGGGGSSSSSSSSGSDRSSSSSSDSDSDSSSGSDSDSDDEDEAEQPPPPVGGGSGHN